MKSVVIVSALRTAIGKFGGSLKGVSAHKLGATVIKNGLEKTGIAPAEVSEVIMGQVLTAGQGQNPARQASMLAEIPQEVPAFTINQVCGSGLKAIMLGAQAIMAGEAKIIIAGGQENMSRSLHATFLRAPTRMGHANMVDTMLLDGLWDAFNDIHMGITAENIADKFKIGRDEQDLFAFNSQQKAKTAIEENKFKNQIVPVEIGEEKFIKDEFPNLRMPEELGSLKPAFQKNGTVTAGNSSGINDGSAMVILMSEEEAVKRNLTPLAVIKSFATVGVDPLLMGTAPVPASKLALKKASWSAQELDLIEANEAFASQAIYVNRNMDWNPNSVNVNGGAIALGHPIGASGTRCLTTLVHEMERKNHKKGLVTLCVGGGMGVAMCLER